MRYFIALEIPKENLAQFQAIQDSLRTLIPQLRLTALGKIHLTLAFVGEQPDQLQNNLIKIIQDAAAGISAFSVIPAYLDGFPTIHHPDCLWIGVNGQIDKLLLIRERIKDSLESLHLPIDERRFIPHITVAKINNNLQINRQLEANLEKIMSAHFDPIEISSIKLFASIPENGFHKHNTLAEIKLAPSSITP